MPTTAPAPVQRRAKLFEAGSYPDKGVNVTSADLARIAAAFSVPVPIWIEHSDSPLELGFVTALRADAGVLFGTLDFSPEAHALVEKSGAKGLSVGLAPDLSAVREVSLVRHPRVADARLFTRDMVVFVTTLDVASPEPTPAPPAPEPHRMGTGPMANQPGTDPQKGVLAQAVATLLGFFSGEPATDSNPGAASATPSAPPAPPAVAPATPPAPAFSDADRAELEQYRREKAARSVPDDQEAKIAAYGEEVYDRLFAQEQAFPFEKGSVTTLFGQALRDDNPDGVCFSTLGAKPGDRCRQLLAHFEARPKLDFGAQKLVQGGQANPTRQVLADADDTVQMSGERFQDLMSHTAVGRAILREKK